MSKKQSLAINSISMLSGKLVQGIASFVLTATIARTLGASALGEYVLGIGYFYIFVSLASQGFKTLFTREIARDPELTVPYLINGTLLQLFFSIIGYITLVALIYSLPYNSHTTFICCLIGSAIIPFSLSNITEAVFQAQEKMHLIAISTVPVYLLRLFAMIWAMQLHHGIEYIAAIFTISESLILIIEWFLLARIVKLKWQIDLDFILTILKTARTFFALEGIGVIAAKLDILLLSILGNEFLVGIYGALSQILQPFGLISSSLSLAAFPGMSKAVHLGKDKQRESLENIIELLLCMGLPLFTGILFFGKELLLLLYKDSSFGDAYIVLNIISLSLIGSSFSRAFSYLLIVNGFEKFQLIEVAITTIVGGLTGTFLIAQYKLMGTAFMSIAITISNLSVLTYFVYTRLFALDLWRVIRRPLAISLLMAIIFLILEQTSLNFSMILAIATFSYMSLITLFLIHGFGGYHAVYTKLFNHKSS
jgi:O-antigen/teichoic acid export membrane protein